MANKKVMVKIDLDFTTNKASIEEIRKQLNLAFQALKVNLNKSDFDRVKSQFKELQRLAELAYNPNTQKINTKKLDKFIINSSDIYNLKELNSLLAQGGVNGQKSFNAIENANKQVRKGLVESNNLLSKMGTTLMNTIRWNISSTAVHAFTGELQKSYYFAKDLDRSLTQIRMVSGLSADEMDRFAVSANKASQELKVSTIDYARASQIFFQQGLNAIEAQRMAEASIIGANITGETTEELSNLLTSVVNGYRMATEDVLQVTDKLAAVGANTAADFYELATAMSKVSSMAKSAGVPLDELNAQISTIASVTKESPESIGTSLKTIYGRMLAFKADTKALMEDEDGEMFGAPAVEKALQAYSRATGAQISLFETAADGTKHLRDLNEVLNDVGDSWDSTTDNVAKFGVATALAGSRQQNRLVALFNSWDKYKEAVEISLNSEGTSLKQNELYIDSYQGKLKGLQSAKEELYMTLIDTGGLKDFVEGLTTGVKLLTTMSELTSGMYGIFGGIVSLISSTQMPVLLSGVDKISRTMSPGNVDKLHGEELEIQNQLLILQKTRGKEEAKAYEKRILQAETNRKNLETERNLLEEQSVLYDLIFKSMPIGPKEYSDKRVNTFFEYLTEGEGAEPATKSKRIMDAVKDLQQQYLKLNEARRELNILASEEGVFDGNPPAEFAIKVNKVIDEVDSLEKGFIKTKRAAREAFEEAAKGANIALKSEQLEKETLRKDAEADATRMRNMQAFNAALSLTPAIFATARKETTDWTDVLKTSLSMTTMQLPTIISQVSKIGPKLAEAAGGAAKFGVLMTEAPILPIVLAVTALGLAINSAVNHANRLKVALEKVAEVSGELEELEVSKKSQEEELKNIRDRLKEIKDLEEDRTAEDEKEERILQNRLEQLMQELAIQKDLIELKKDEVRLSTLEAMNETQTSKYGTEEKTYRRGGVKFTYNDAIQATPLEELGHIYKAYEDINKEAKKLSEETDATVRESKAYKASLEENKKKQAEIVQDLIDQLEIVKELRKGLGEKPQEEDQELAERYERYIEATEKALAIRHEESGILQAIRELLGETIELSEEEERLAEARSKTYKSLYEDISKATDSQDLLNKALAELTDEGEISKSTLDKLIEVNDDFIEVLTLEESEVRALIQAYKDKNTEGLRDLIQDQKNVIEAAEKKIAAVDGEILATGALIDARKKLASIDPVTGVLVHQGTMGVNVKKQLEIIEKAKSNIKLLEAGIKSVENRKDKSAASKSTASKSTASTKKAKEEYKALADIYERINQELERNSAALARNQAMQKLAGEDVTRKIELINEEISLYIKQKSLLEELNLARKERGKELQKELSSIFKFEGSWDDGSIVITNLEAIEGKSKEVEANFKEILSIMKDIATTETEVLNVLNQINTSSLQLLNTELQIFETRNQAINGLLKENNNELMRMKTSLGFVTEGTQEHLDLLKRENGLYKERQDLIDKSLAEERRQSVALKERITFLSGGAAKFSGIGDSLRVSNVASLDLASNPALEKALSEFNKKQMDTIPQLQNEWWNYQKSVVNNINKMKSNIQSHISQLESLRSQLDSLNYEEQMRDLKNQLERARFDHWLEELVLRLEGLSNKTELLTFKLSLFDEEDAESRAEILGDLYSSSKEELAGLQAEFDTLAKTTPKNAEEANKMAGAMQNIQQKMREAYTATREYQRQLERLQFDTIGKDIAKAGKQLQTFKSIAEFNLGQIQDGILPDFTFDMVMPIPDFTDILAEQKSENERIYNDQLAMEEQIQALKKWSNDEQLAEAERYYQEETAKLQAHYDKLMADIAAKEAEVKTLQEQLKKEQEAMLKDMEERILKMISEEKLKQLKEEIKWEELTIDQKLEYYTLLLLDLENELLTPEKEAITDNQEQIFETTQDYLNRMEKAYSTAWNSISSVVARATASIAESAEDAIDSIKAVRDAAEEVKDAVSSGDSKSSGRSGGSGVTVSPYAKGTDGHPGGLALVGDEFKGAYELGILPGGKTVLFGKNGSELVNLPKGTQIIPHKKTKEMMRSVPAYASGTCPPGYEYVSATGRCEKIMTQEEILAGMKEEAKKLEGESKKNVQNVIDQMEGLDSRRSSKDRDVYDDYYYGLPETTGKLVGDYGYTKDYSNKLRYYEDQLKMHITADERRWLKQEIQRIRDYYDDIGVSQPSGGSGGGSGPRPGGGSGSGGSSRPPSSGSTGSGIDRLRFNATMSEDFIKGSGKYAEEMYSMFGFGGYDDYTDNRKKTLEEIAKLQDDYLNALDLQITKEDILLKIDEQLLEDARVQSWLRIDLLEQEKENIKEYADLAKAEYEKAMESGNIELAREAHQRYNEALLEQLNLEKQIQTAMKQRHDMEFALVDKKINSNKKYMDELAYQLKLEQTLHPSAIERINGLYDKQVDSIHSQVIEMYEHLSQLKEYQSLLAVGSYEWNIIENRIDNVVAKMRSANLEMANIAKSSLTSFLGGFKDGVLDRNKSPDEGSASDDSDKWLEGLEKELEIEKLMRFVEKNKLELNEKQLEIIQRQGKIRKSELAVVQKELELQQLLMKIENMRNQKTIQQLTKREDGTWDYEYTADLAAIEQLEEQIIDARLGVVKAEQALEKELAGEQATASQNAYDEKIKQFEDVMQKAEERVYKSAEEFKATLLDTGLDFAEGWVDEAVDKYWDYFLKTAAIFIEEAVHKTREILKSQADIFEKIGNEAGEGYTRGLVDKIDDIMASDGDILEKQKQIIDLLAGEYVEFALAGNKNGLSFIEGLIESMGTVDYEYDFNDAVEGIKSALVAQANKLSEGGQELGSAFVNGLIGSIDDILKDESIENKTQAILDLLDKANEYGTLGESLGNEFMQGLVTTIENITEEVSGEGEGALSMALGSMIGMLDEKIGDFAEKGDVQGVAYAEALKVRLIEALENAELTQEDIINLLAEFQEFDLAGLLSGEAYGDSLTEGLDDAGASAKDRTSAIVAGLEEDVASFADAGSAQGEAYGNAITNAFQSAIANVKSLVGDLVSYVNSSSFKVNVGVSDSLPSNIQGFDSGGYTGSFKGGKLGVLHEKELILNQLDTKNLLDAVSITRDLAKGVTLPNPRDFQPTASGGNGDQIFHIEKLEFPNVTDSDGLKEVFDNLPNVVRQYVR